MTDTIRDEQKCPSYSGVSPKGMIVNRNPPLGHDKLSVLERFPSYGMSVLVGFMYTKIPNISPELINISKHVMVMAYIVEALYSRWLISGGQIVLVYLDPRRSIIIHVFL